MLSLGWVYMHFRFFAPLLQKVPNKVISEDEKKLEEHLEAEKKENIPKLVIKTVNEIRIK
jgi:hypothetical protein